jgi:hypothetical protein
MKTSSTLFSQANPGDLVTPFEDHSVIVFVISEDRDDDSSENCGLCLDAGYTYCDRVCIVFMGSPLQNGGSVMRDIEQVS